MVMNFIQTIIKESQLQEAQKTGQEVRYKIILNTQVIGGSFSWTSKISATSQTEAIEKARKFFMKHRGELQEAILHEWNVGTITPLATYKQPVTPKRNGVS